MFSRVSVSSVTRRLRLTLPLFRRRFAFASRRCFPGVSLATARPFATNATDSSSVKRAIFEGAKLRCSHGTVKSKEEFRADYVKLMTAGLKSADIMGLQLSGDREWLWADDPSLDEWRERNGVEHLPLNHHLQVLDSSQTLGFGNSADDVALMASVMTSERSAEVKRVLKNVPKIGARNVFANNVTNCQNVKAYGFDFDYTLANYTRAMSEFIYTRTIEYLIDELGYPKSSLVKTDGSSDYDPEFAIRGLAFDKKTGNLMKLDQFYKYSPRILFHGKQRLERAEALQQYNGLRISEEYFRANIRELGDLFGLPEAYIYAHVFDCLERDGLDFTPEYVFEDIQQALNFIHDSGLLHRTIRSDPSKYMRKDPQFSALFRALMDSDISLFMLTNNSYANVAPLCDWLLEDALSDLGLSPTTGGFVELFDLGVFVRAHKPQWFLENKDRHFRRMDPATGHLTLDKTCDIHGGGVFVGGSLSEFKRRTKLAYDEILYFGDSVKSDMTGPFKSGQWLICAICHELEHEVAVNNDDTFRSLLFEMMTLEQAIVESQHLAHDDTEAADMILNLRKKRAVIRGLIYRCYNKQFGSFLRTHSTRSLFFHRLARYSDLYTSQLTNMLGYGFRDIFQPRRQFYDHEPGYVWPMTSPP